MIEEFQKEDGSRVYKYKGPDTKYRFDYVAGISAIFDDYVEANGFAKDHISQDMGLLVQICLRVDKRKDYFLIYHDETYLNEVRESALLAYWILKFKPFLYSDEGEYSDKNNHNINCGFAAYIILSAVEECIKRKTNNKSGLKLSDAYLDKFKYALKFWDIGKEAMMLIAETLCEHVMYTGDS